MERRIEDPKSWALQQAQNDVKEMNREFYDTVPTRAGIVGNNIPKFTG